MMKKVIFTAIGTLVLSSVAFSQTPYNKGFRLGLGLNGGFQKKHQLPLPQDTRICLQNLNK